MLLPWSASKDFPSHLEYNSRSLPQSQGPASSGSRLPLGPPPRPPPPHFLCSLWPHWLPGCAWTSQSCFISGPSASLAGLALVWPLHSAGSFFSIGVSAQGSSLPASSSHGRGLYMNSLRVSFTQWCPQASNRYLMHCRSCNKHWLNKEWADCKRRLFYPKRAGDEKEKLLWMG